MPSVLFPNGRRIWASNLVVGPNTLEHCTSMREGAFRDPFESRLGYQMHGDNVSLSLSFKFAPCR